MATEVLLYHCHTQDWAGRSLPSSFPTGKETQQPSSRSQFLGQPKAGPKGCREGTGEVGGSVARPPRYRVQPLIAIGSGP